MPVFFFLGGIYTDLPLPVDYGGQRHCRTAPCINRLPTAAIVAPYRSRASLSVLPDH